MNKKNIIKMGTAGLCMLMLTGCGGQNKKTYDQAVTDLEQGSYDYALEGYKSSITAGYKSAESYRGGRYSKPSSWQLPRCDRLSHQWD